MSLFPFAVTLLSGGGVFRAPVKAYLSWLHLVHKVAQKDAAVDSFKQHFDMF